MGSESSKPVDDHVRTDTTPIFSVVNTEEVTVVNDDDGYEIQCKLWTAKEGQRSARAMAVYIHGGIFSRNDKNSHQNVIESLVKDCGITILSANFRDGGTGSVTYQSGKTISDLQSITKYLKQRSSIISDDPDSKNKNKNNLLPLGIIGSSSGGYFALQLCNSFQSFEEVANDLNIQFCIPICPVADPFKRAMYLKEYCIERNEAPQDSPYYVRHTVEQAKFILHHQLKYFQNFEQMKFATEEIVENKYNIPTLVIVGANDANVPYQVTQHVQHTWSYRTILLGQNCGHEIQMDIPTTHPNLNYIPDIDRFLNEYCT